MLRRATWVAIWAVALVALAIGLWYVVVRVIL